MHVVYHFYTFFLSIIFYFLFSTLYLLNIVHSILRTLFVSFHNVVNDASEAIVCRRSAESAINWFPTLPSNGCAVHSISPFNTSSFYILHKIAANCIKCINLTKCILLNAPQFCLVWKFSLTKKLQNCQSKRKSNKAKHLAQERDRYMLISRRRSEKFDTQSYRKITAERYTFL